MKNVCVTGGSGGVGIAVIKELIAHGYSCVNVDIKPPKEALCPFIKVDTTDYQATFDAMAGQDALVHLAGNPVPDQNHFEAADRFENNTVSLFNCLNAAQAHGIKRVVWASSETILGFPFETNRQKTLPLDETSEAQPQNGYAISKAISETMAEHMAKLYGMTIIGLRLSNVLFYDPDADASYQKIPGYWEDMASRQFNLWGYIDNRDSAVAFRLGLEADITGAEVFNILAKETLMRQSSKTLVDAIMPESALDPKVTGNLALVEGDKARKMLGFEPKYSWQQVLGMSA